MIQLRPFASLCRSLLSAAALSLTLASAGWAGNVTTIVSYRSSVSVDTNGPLDLNVELNYDDARSGAPIAVVMHQYTDLDGNFAGYRANAQRLRDAGFFVLTPAMRQRDGSDGKRDSGGLEIYDIYDAIEHVKQTYPTLVNATRVYITGYSGGGGNVMSAITKFPDYFTAAAAFFGMSDYGYDPVNGWYNNGAGSGRHGTLHSDIGNPVTGGNPVKDKYMARASNLASKNNPYTEIHLFVNANETICPPINDTSYLDNAIAAAEFPGEFNNITVHIGSAGTYRDFNQNGQNDPGEEQNWPHAAPSASQQASAESWFLSRLVGGQIPAPVLNLNDTLFVAGYVKTKRFGLWVGDGQNATGNLTYNLDPALHEYAFTVASLDQTVTAVLTAETSSFTDAAVLVKVNGVEVATVTKGPVYRHEGLRHGDILTLEGTTATPPEPPRAKVIGHWRFENAPGFLADSGPAALALTTSGSTPPTQFVLPASGAGSAFDDPLPATAQPNAAAAQFGTGQTGHFARPDATGFYAGDFTVEAYVNRSATTSGTQYIASQWTQTGGQRSWGLGVAGSSPPSGLVAGELFITISADGAAGTVIGSGLTVSQGVDTYVACAIDLANTAAGIRFFVKYLAAQDLRTSTRPAPFAALHNSTGNLNIGAYNEGQNRWTGIIDEVRLSDVALLAGELLIAVADVTFPPGVEPASQFSFEPVQVTMVNNDPGATIRYTLDSSTPTETSPVYIAPFTVSATTTVSARAFKSGTSPSATVTAIYTVSNFLPLGKVPARHASEITSSNWTIGCETLDRDHAIYANYSSYLGPLGAKKARLQCGWAKTEKTPGVYDWAWLDAIVNDVVAQQVKPWLQTSYGNTIYTGGGGTTLGGGLPTSATALAAWDAWVRALVQRYRDRTDEWEVWNEPDGGGITATAYADFYIRTAEIIRQEQPTARIAAISLANTGSTTYINGFLQRLQSQGKLGLCNEITHHGYPTNPDSIAGNVQSMRNAIANYSSTIKLRQGESGAPSTFGSTGALGSSPFTELKQAKWDLRRMLGDLSRDQESAVFTLMEFFYPQGLNTKGLLKSNANKTVAYAKPAYFAVQNVTAIFDHSLTRIPSYGYSSTSSTQLALSAYAKNGTGKQAVTAWFSNAMPSDSTNRTPVNFTFTSGSFDDPVYVDLREGKIYDIPASNWSRTGASYTFTQIPCYDSPILIADKSVFGMPVDAWKKSYFTTAELAAPGIAGLNDDFDKDGLTTMQEYVLGSNPAAAAERGVQQTGEVTVGGQRYLTLTYSRHRDLPDVRVVPQVSSNLQTWQSGPAYLVEHSVTPAGAVDLVTVRDLTPIAAGNPRFLRLHIYTP